MADSSFFTVPTTPGSARERARALHWDVDPAPSYSKANWQGRVDADRRRWWNCQLERAVRAGRMQEDPRVARPWERVRSRYSGAYVRRTRPPEGRQEALELERREA